MLGWIFQFGNAAGAFPAPFVLLAWDESRVEPCPCKGCGSIVAGWGFGGFSSDFGRGGAVVEGGATDGAKEHAMGRNGERFELQFASVAVHRVGAHLNEIETREAVVEVTRNSRRDAFFTNMNRGFEELAVAAENAPVGAG